MNAEIDLSGPDGVADGSPWYADAPHVCERCGEEIDGFRNEKAYHELGETVCDLCAEEIFKEAER